MKKILGLDLGTNSIGWALISTDEDGKPCKINGIGSRIIPMSQEVLGKFDSGQTVSQTAERTKFRGIRRLRERHLLRRERLHRVLNILGYLPEHYSNSIDFENKLGQFIENTEPKLAWKKDQNGKYDFLFKSSFNEMVNEFKAVNQDFFALNPNGKQKKIPYDWTIYYLRKKALSTKIEKEELAWLLINFNQKRGYYQLREEDDDEIQNKLVEFHALKVTDVIAEEQQKGKTDIWYNVILENGWIYRRSSKTPLFEWKNKIKEFIVTTDLNDDGSIKLDKEGNQKRSFRAPSDDDWTLLKKKTEADIDKGHMTVGCYIYNSILQNPNQKINGKLVRTIERNHYKQELEAILDKQKEFHTELSDSKIYQLCLNELYKNNVAHRNSILTKDFTHLFINDIIFYQRPLKSKKTLISNCKYEIRYKDKGKSTEEKYPIKCIAKSHPLFQEMRLWKFVNDLRILEREKEVDGKLRMDVDVTAEFLKSEDDYVALFDWLNDKNDIQQDTLFSSYFKIRKKKGEERYLYRWNYVEGKNYLCNKTRAQILSSLSKVSNLTADFLTKEIELKLWHILYSIEDKFEIEKALKSFSSKHNLSNEFVDVFKKFPTFKKEYGSYSAKAIKKILSLMRKGKYWDENNIDKNTKDRIDKIISGEYDEKIRNRVREKAINLREIKHFKGLPEWLACYVIYDRHSESGDILNWKTPQDIENYLKYEFKQHSLRNPIVEQVITETLRVVKDIWKQYGDFSEIHIELGREMKNPADIRKSMTEQISQNENTNLRIKALLAELSNHDDIENVRPYSPSQQEILKIYEEGVLNSGIEIPDDILKISKTSQPSKSELIRYKLWLEQKYRSPYTGEMIPLNKLFTSAYQIEHIIPQSRYFDDSLSNKVICEAEVNLEKENALGYEFIKNNEGRIIELSFGKKVKIFTLQEYEDFVKLHYSKNRNKMKKLLMEDLTEDFIDRQLNDSRYISKVVKSLMSNIVRENDETEAISKNVIPCTGMITDTLKKDWGLNDVWNKIITPRFERMNELTKSKDFGHWTIKDGKRIFQTEVPLILQKGFQKKRIDHRHHAMDALVIACATRNHINYLNNEHAKQKNSDIRYDLRNKLRRIEEVEVDRIENGNKVRKKIKVAKEFHKPWDTFTQDAQNALENIVVSFKQNLRIINRTTNKYQHFENGKKVIAKQTKGDNWAIRKPLHKDTVSGIVNLRFKKGVNLLTAIDKWEMIVDKGLKSKIKQLIDEGLDKKKIQKYFAEQDYKWMGKELNKIELYYFSSEKESDVLVASRVNLDESFNAKKIESITDSGIRKILTNHLKNYESEGKEHPELAFSPEGIQAMNENISLLNDGKNHKPIYKVRTYKPKRNKFNVGTKGNKKFKFVEAAKGTNLFFAIYTDENGKRSYESIPLNIVIERLKQGQNPVNMEKIDEKGNVHKLLFYLNPNDIVYVPTFEQIENNWSLNVSDIQLDRLYRFTDSSDTTANFVPISTASLIFSMNKKDQEKIGIDFGIQNELGVGSAQSKNQKSITGEMIKEVCIKLKVDRLGNIELAK